MKPIKPLAQLGRAPEQGRIRLGVKTERAMKSLDTFRFTSLDKSAIGGRLKALGMSHTSFLGLANRAAKLVLTELDFHFHDLPPAFDGYRILHISDPHFDSLPQLEEAIDRKSVV